MRLIILLIVLAIGALLIAQQLQKRNEPVHRGTTGMIPKTVRVPTTPQDLPTFQKSINKLVLRDNDKEKMLIRKETQ